jgi:hypothetical protein
MYEAQRAAAGKVLAVLYCTPGAGAYLYIIKIFLDFPTPFLIGINAILFSTVGTVQC